MLKSISDHYLKARKDLAREKTRRLQAFYAKYLQRLLIFDMHCITFNR